jgi:phage terminase large subunit GpA-like protein
MNYQARWSTPDRDYAQAAAVETILRGAMRPDPVLSVSQWADRYRILSTRLAAEAGRYRTDRAPFLRDVMDALSPSHRARRVVFMKAAQVGATEAGNNWLGYIIHWSPAPVMAVWPTVDTAKKVSRQRVEPLIEDCPELAELIAPSKAKDSGNTILSKSFPGGILVMTGANSGVGLRSMPARYAFLDEIDAYPGDVDGEGDPIALVANRTTTFGRSAKMFLVSTPTVHGVSRIEREYEASDQRRYFVPCPHCGGMQWLKFERLRWDRGAPDTVAYICEHCEERIEERHKAMMLPEGQWQPTAAPVDPGCIGFHISGLYSPLGWLSWVDIAREWEAAQGNAAALKSFKNTRLGETWFEESEAVEWQKVYDRREDWKEGTAPRDVTIVTAGIDWQRDRAELHVWGWGQGLESWALDRHIVYGKPDDPATRSKLDELIDTLTYRHPSGVDMRIEYTAVDTGDQTTSVYEWILTRDQSRTLAVKGKAGFDVNSPVTTPTYVAAGRRKKAIRLRSVMGDVFKAELYRWLAAARPTDEQIETEGFPPGWVHVPGFFDDEWCRQLVSERRVRLKSGRFEWKKEHERNEVLDARNYARAALWVHGVMAWRPERWQREREKRGLNIELEADTPDDGRPTPPPSLAPKKPLFARRVSRSSFMSR